MDITEILQKKTNIVEIALKQVFPKENGFDKDIFKAMEYSLFAGGKRLRPVLLLSVCEALGGDVKKAVPFACSIEMIHTYSLIHDDLPAMDNDDYRRGKWTNHKVFGDDIAILAGDGLLHHAMETMVEACVVDCNERTVGAMAAIAHGAGVYGMLSGQVIDVISEGKEIDQEILDTIHLRKTAAMIQGAMKAGAILGGGDAEVVEKFNLVGEKIGLAFQIEDDILDVISTQEELGKPIGSDEKNAKMTYVTLFGLERAQEIVKELSDEAMYVLKELGEETKFLQELTLKLVGRRF